MHRAAHCRADEDPEEAGKVAELRREHGADERSRPGDGGEVVAEKHPLVRGLEVRPVLEPVRRRAVPAVERKHFRREKGAVEAVHEHIETARRGDNPERVDLFGGVHEPRHDPDGERSDEGEKRPEDFINHLHESEPFRKTAAKY